MRDWVRIAIGTIALSGCATGGYQVVTGTRAARFSESSGVILYGVDSGAPQPPPGCPALGTVRAWSFGEKTFPHDQLRAAAAELGGDSVVDIHPDPSATEKSRPTHLGTVQRCR